jgi:tellurite resistance protein TerC
MLDVTTELWVITVGLVVGLLAADLVLSVVRPHAVGFPEALAWSLFYIAVAVTFGLVLLGTYGTEIGTQFFAGYVVEKGLSGYPTGTSTRR